MTTRETKIVVSLFDYTGEALRPWAEQGYDCVALDIQHPVSDFPRIDFVGDGSIAYIHWDADVSLPADAARKVIQQVFPSFEWSRSKVKFLFGWPPCNDLASSGAKHFASKLEADPDCQIRAVGRALLVEAIGTMYQIPWMVENPVGRMSTLWRQPDFKFDPCDFGGYCPLGPHPRWPDYIPEQDAYTKKTCIWIGAGAKIPALRRVEPVTMTATRKDGSTTSGSPQWAKLGGKSQKTKNIRSATPRGWANAVMVANYY